MTKSEALLECESLWTLVGEWPYADLEAIERARRFSRALSCGPNTSPYICEKAGTIVELFEHWFTEKRWRQYGDEPFRLRAIVLSNIGNLRRAISSEYGVDPE